MRTQGNLTAAPGLLVSLIHLGATKKAQPECQRLMTGHALYNLSP